MNVSGWVAALTVGEGEVEGLFNGMFIYKIILYILIPLINQTSIDQ